MRRLRAVRARPRFADVHSEGELRGHVSRDGARRASSLPALRVSRAIDTTTSLRRQSIHAVEPICHVPIRPFASGAIARTARHTVSQRHSNEPCPPPANLLPALSRPPLVTGISAPGPRGASRSGGSQPAPLGCPVAVALALRLPRSYVRHLTRRAVDSHSFAVLATDALG